MVRSNGTLVMDSHDASELGLAKDRARLPIGTMEALG